MKDNLRCVVERASRPGQDAQIFRSRGNRQVDGAIRSPFSVSASTTGTESFGVKRCAGKAFAAMQGIDLPKLASALDRTLNELAEQIQSVWVKDGTWVCELPGCYDIGLLCPPQPRSDRIIGSES